MNPEDLALMVADRRAALHTLAPKRRIPELAALSVRSRVGRSLVRLGLRLVPAPERRTLAVQ